MSTHVPTLREWVRDHDEKWLFVVLYLGLAVGLSVLVSLFWLLVVAVLHLVLELVRQAQYRDGKVNVALHALWEVKLDVALILLALTLVLYIEVVLGLLGIQSAGRALAVSRAGSRVATRVAAWERNLRTFLLTVDEMARVAHAGFMLRRKRRDRVEASEASSAELAVEVATPILEVPVESATPILEVPVEVATPILEVPVESATPILEVPDEGVTEEACGGGDGPPPAEVAEPKGSPVPVWREEWKVVDYVGLGLVAAGIALILAAPWFTLHDWASVAGSLLEELRPFPGPSSQW
jgi:hypothetical protein